MSKEDNSVRISYSSANRFKACPRKYWLSKEYKDKSTSSALCFGKALENGVEIILKGGTLEEGKKLFNEHWSILPEDQYSPPFEVYDNSLVKYYASDLDLIAIEQQADIANQWCQEIVGCDDFKAVCDELKGETLSLEERKLINRLSWLALQIRGHIMLEAFTTDVFPNITEVIDIQRSVSIKNKEGDEKMGYVDLICRYKGYDKPIVFDLKTAAYPYKLHQLDTSEQLLGYSIALEEELDSNLIGYMILLKKPEAKKSCAECGVKPRSGLIRKCKECGSTTFNRTLKGKTQILIKEADEHNLNDLVEDDSQIVRAIKAGVDYKNPSSCMMFNSKCEFYDVCWNNKKPCEIKNLEFKEKKDGKK